MSSANVMEHWVVSIKRRPDSGVQVWLQDKNNEEDPTVAVRYVPPYQAENWTDEQALEAAREAVAHPAFLADAWSASGRRSRACRVIEGWRKRLRGRPAAFPEHGDIRMA